MGRDSFIEKMKEQDRKKQEFRTSLAYSTDYIDWLEKFTQRFGSFSTDTFLYNDELLSEQDKENVFHLESFFEEIYDYAEENYLPHHQVSYGIYYPIEHNGVGYSIGIDYGQGCMFYCDRLDCPDEDAIEYKHIMSSVKLPNTIFLDSKLDELVQVIEQLYEEKIPIESIEKVANQAIKRIKTEQSEKIKKKV